ncbi:MULTISPECIES: hypothetical protein [Sphingobium]|uniref:hypothetical protein n=1 Tax=Sphingobium TaxID=165695 RepID=UPI0011D0BF76|nr:hypothetical protein [Sphingobium indicum]
MALPSLSFPRRNLKPLSRLRLDDLQMAFIRASGAHLLPMLTKNRQLRFVIFPMWIHVGEPGDER